MSETCAKLVTRLLILCLNYFLLWPFGSEFKTLTVAQTQATLPDIEVSALEEIAKKLNYYPDGQAINFKDTSFCNPSDLSYTDISCDCTFQNDTICHITFIGLSSKYLDGVIPEELANLTHLESLHLSDNQLHGSIPAALGTLASLSKFLVRDNQLHGSIPATLGTLASLSILDLSYNQLTGSIPTTLGNLKSAISMDLSNNHLTGSIPESFGNLTYLDQLKLGSNYLNGYIPSSLGHLSHLTGLYMDDNGLSGVLPRAIGNLQNLTFFSVRSNNITGTLPESYANLTMMSTFSISGNYMSGRIPDCIANWTSIIILSLYGNNFRGTIPSRIFNLSNLQILTISDAGDSQLQFPIYANLTRMYSLILRNCSVSGQIPAYIGDMPSLTYLDLSFNKLTGRIPDSLRKLNLTYMSFAKNMLNGTIPAWIPGAKWTKMDLSYNNFSKLPFAPSSKLDLNLFACCCNSSTCLPNTTYPNQIMEKINCSRGKPNYHSLFINCGGEETNIEGNVYEKDNDTGQFYVSPKGNWAYSSSGGFLSVYSNSTDYIKRTPYGISALDAPLYENARSSPVSLKYYGFCLHKGKYNVALHFAEISYSEDEPANSSKRVFDVYIQGERVLMDFNIKDRAGGVNKVCVENLTAHVNHGVLEIHFYWAGKGSSDDEQPFLIFPVSPIPIRSLNGPLISAISVTPAFKLGGLSPLHITLITVASAIVFVLLLLAFAWMMGWIGNTDHLKEINVGLEKPVTLKQLKDATRNFSKKNEIGQGGFGIVYKAELRAHIVAVKRLSSHSEERIRELKNEFYTLKSLSQENLVQLLDVYHGKDLHLLIYEYMANNSLAHALFDSKSKLKLDWEQRYNICLGVARGLVYLHEHPRLSMVHRDIKAANILLDERFEAKISDFGLASLYNEDDQIKFIKVEVPQGYMAPEYVQGFVTYKADVYSFGVVILELVSGRKNAEHKSGQESEFLLDTAFDLHRKGRLMDLVDKNLSGMYDAKSAIIILNLAVKCTNISPTLRPTMSEVVSVLLGEKRIEEISPHALNDGSLAQVGSSASVEVISSKASTSSNFNGEDVSTSSVVPSVSDIEALNAQIAALQQKLHRLTTLQMQHNPDTISSEQPEV